MTWRSRLTNGLTKLGIIDSPATPRSRPLGSVGVQDVKSFMTYEAMPGFSQPVWGPEISTVGAYSREGYTSRTFDTPAISFKQQAAALQVDEDAQLAINHLASQVTGGEHYIKAEKSEYVDFFTEFTTDLMFDTWDTRLVKELLWYGNSIWKPRMGISNVRRFEDLMHIPISSFVRVWWDRQRIPYKYEFRGAEYQGYHNPGEIIHFNWNPVDASIFGTGFGISMTSPRIFTMPTPEGTVTNTLPSLLERKYATQFNMQMAEQRYISRNVWVVDSGSEEDRKVLEGQVNNLEVGQDVVAGTKVEVQELGTQARNFNPSQFADLTIGPIFKAMNDFRGKQGSSESHQYANAKTSAVLDEIGLSAFPIAVKEQLVEKFFKPWYQANGIPDARTGGLTMVPWRELGFELEFGEVEKKDISVQDQIKLLEIYIQSPIPKDPAELRKLFEQAGLGLTKDIDVQLEQMYNDPMGVMALQNVGAEPSQSGVQPTGQPFYDDNMNLPYNDTGGGETPPYFNNQRMGSPPMDNPIYDSMMKDVRGDIKNKYKRGDQSQDWQIGRGYE